MAVEVFLETSTPPVYGDWEESRRNVFDDPFMLGQLAADFSASTGTLSFPSGAAFGRTAAARWANTANGAQRDGIVYNFQSGQVYTVRFRARGFQSRTSWTITIRNVPATSILSVATGVTIDTTVREYEYTFTGPANNASATRGLYIVNASGFTGEWIEVVDYEIELGDHTGQGWIGGPRTAELETVSWEGAANNSDMILETRAIISASPRPMSGGIGSVSGYSVDQDATPISPTQMSAGTPSFNVEVQPGKLLDTIRQRGRGIMLHDDEDRGVMLGEVDGFTLTADGLTLRALTPLSKLVAQVSLEPYNGTLEDYFSGLLFRADEAIQVEYRGGVGSIMLTMPAVQDSAWTIINEVCVANGIECAMRGTYVSFRPVRGAVFLYERLSGMDHSIDAGPRSRTIEVVNQRAQWADGELLWPRPEEVERLRNAVVTAGANQTMRVDLRLTGASAETLVQPVCVGGDVDVDAYGSSCYSVLDRNNLPVDPAWWAENGGSVSLVVLEGSDQIRAILQTPNRRDRAPFSIAKMDSDGNPYSSLRVYGSGVLLTPVTISFPTGAHENEVAQDVGVLIDLPSIGTYEQAYLAAQHAMAEYSAPQQTLSATLHLPRLIALSPEWASMIFDELNITLGDDTFTEFNTAFSGLTFDEFNESLDASAMERFSKQLFSVLVGARIRYAFSYFRIVNVSMSPESITIDAVADTIVDDTEALWADMTYEEVELLLGANLTWEDWEMVPLSLGEATGTYGGGFYGTGIYGLGE